MQVFTLAERPAADMELFLQPRDPEAARLFARLMNDRETEPGLCFLACEGGTVKGALVVCFGRSESVRIGIAAVLCADHRDISLLLLTQAAIALRERRIPYFIAQGGEELFDERKDWDWILHRGFVPPRLDESALGFYCNRLTDTAVPTTMPIEFPAAMGLPIPECRFVGRNSMDAEHYAEAVYTTRERRRLAERAAIIIFIIAVSVITLVRKDYYVLPAVGIGLYALFINIFRPRRIVAEEMELWKKRGKEKCDDSIFFGDEGFIFFSRKRGRSIMHYDNLRTAYVKRDFIFLCRSVGKESASGYYIENTSLENKQEFLDFLKSKNPLIVFKK